MARFKFGLFPLSSKPPARIILDEASDKPRGLGALAKLPLEIRTRIWLAWAKDETPRDSYKRLYRLSRWMAFESYHILIFRRCLTFDLSSYKQTPGGWISEFYVHDQHGCRWRVTPQFGGKCSTLEGAENLDAFVADLISSTGGRERRSVPVRIKLAAPQDGGEILVLWNRMRWLAHFIHRHTSANKWEDPFIANWARVYGPTRAVPRRKSEPLQFHLQFELLETHGRPWWRPSTGTNSAVRTLPVNDFVNALNLQGRSMELQYGELLMIHLFRGNLVSFALSPFAHWTEKFNLCFRSGSYAHVKWRRRMKDILPSVSEKLRIKFRVCTSKVCPQWPRHVLDALGQMPSTNLLRLEMLASIDARRNESFTIIHNGRYDPQGRCRTCIDQRNAASAYAPRDRDEMLQKIEKKMAKILDAESTSQQVKRKQNARRYHHPLFSEGRAYACFRGCASLPKSDGPHDERNPAEPAFYYSESLKHYSSVIRPQDFEVDCENDPHLDAAFAGIVEDVLFGFPEKVRSIQNYWQSLTHWPRTHPHGIPPPTAEGHAATIREFHNRHVFHPYEICSCKGTSKALEYGCFCNDNSETIYRPSFFRGVEYSYDSDDQGSPEEQLDNQEFDFAIPFDRFPCWERRWKRRGSFWWI